MQIQVLKFFKKEAYIFVSLLFAFSSCSTKTDDKSALEQVKTHYLSQIDSCIHYVNQLKDTTDILTMRSSFMNARNYFKAAEPVLSYVDVENFETLNQPNLLQVEEEDQTNIRIMGPEGFQIIEETLFDDRPDKSLLYSKANFLHARLSFVRKNNLLSNFQEYHFLWMVRNAVVSVPLIGITGFDSPKLANSLADASTIYESLRRYMLMYSDRFVDRKLHNQWIQSLDKTIHSLQNGDFDTYDRYAFIKEFTHPQMKLWNETVRDWQIEFPIELAIQNNAEDLFSFETFNMKFFAGVKALPVNEKTVELGKELFYDNGLSLNSKMSCGTCHLSEKGFSDGKTIAIGLDGKPLQRNTPSLTYAGFQKGFFWDRRTGNLEGQVISVVTNNNEFHTDLKTLTEKVRSKKKYQTAFSEIFEDSINDDQIRKSLASYIRSLAPFNSKFDKNIRGEAETLTAKEISGFNLFMGKAACATCHFPPLFNGTIPPRYKESEMENLGVPETAANETIDDDLGRFHYFDTEEKKFFFKTPTIRNVTLTAPYMHNGVYDSLEQVMDFYNAGGGEGLGYEVPLQTLPSDSLGLSENEIQSIIAFMETLTDETTTDY